MEATGFSMTKEQKEAIKQQENEMNMTQLKLYLGAIVLIRLAGIYLN